MSPQCASGSQAELSYRNDTRIAFFFSANKNKDNGKVALASSNS